LKKKLLSGIIGALSIWGVSANAADIDGAFIISPEFTYHIFDNDRKIYKDGDYRELKDAFEAWLSAEKVLGNVGLGAKLGYGKADVKGSPSEQEFYDLVLFGKYYFTNYQNVLPYISLGVAETKIKNKYLTGGFAGVGLNYIIGNNWGLKFGVDAYNLGKGRTDFMPTIGLTYAAGTTKDSDGDGVPDNVDQCPNTPAGVRVDSTGCPLDSDKDGVPDYKDHCPNTPAGTKVDENGCPIQEPQPMIKDSDGDGVPDDRDRCPNTPRGYKVDENGCFVEARLEIHFDFDSWEVKPEYYPEIEKFARFLKANPNIKVELQGHTDKRGRADYNLWLSQKRAEAVKKILVEKYGISPDRIIARGYGESQPICYEDTEECYAKNRRVVAKLIK
jgi:OOP family OmpA-OmpF porin